MRDIITQKPVPVFFLLLILMIFSACAGELKSEADKGSLMKKAVPVWAKGRDKEMNLTLGFRGSFNAASGGRYVIRVTASCLYRVFLNGEFIGYGPARACHGYFRVDEYNVSERVIRGENIVAFEVAGYNVNTYYTLDQPSFLQAEVESEGQLLLATGSDPGFEAFEPGIREQKVERYSFQRAFIEYYRMSEGADSWKKEGKVKVDALETENLPPVRLLPRNLLLPEFGIVYPRTVISRGKVKTVEQESLARDRSLSRVSDNFKAFQEKELDVIPSLTVQKLENIHADTIQMSATENKNIRIEENGFCIFDMGINLSGFIGSEIRCEKPSTVMFYFDEILLDGDVRQKKRIPSVNNIVTYELEPGTYRLETFETYTFKYLKAIVLRGEVFLGDLYLREYAYPENDNLSFQCSNEKLNEIYLAARQTFRQNTVDIFMDCPSRERGGWLCDSYFTAFVERDFTGKSAVSRNFLENYALPERFENLPEGMIPMCYPGDHPNGNFIPNWSLWFIIQVRDYAQKGGDPQVISQLQPRIEKLLNYFSAFENEDGLLENLEKWIFVEWSKANSFVRDVNYPTNMLYSAALKDAASLYNNKEWKIKADHIKQKVIEQSFNGSFFTDNAVRNKEGKLEVTSNTTEVCQYYAFFFQIATPETHPDLWKKLITEFGPDRNDSIIYPNVFKANAFIGNYLRMDILSRYGLNNQLVKEIQEYFHYMAERTGTLWENVHSQASCNHGFASYIGHLLYQDILGVRDIDYLKKRITVRFSDIDLEECSGTIPLGDQQIEVQWKRAPGNQINYSVKVPGGYKVTVENSSSSRLVKMK